MNTPLLWRFTLAADTPSLPTAGDVGLAFQYGPFFFALLFLIGLVAWTYQNYRGACMRKDPPATPDEVATCRRIFIGTCVVGVCLVACCVVWWWIYKPGAYIFAGEIRGLHDYERITSTELYFKRIQIPLLAARAPGLRDEQFVIIQAKPFKPSDTFRLWFSKSEDNQEEFAIRYAAGAPRYKFEWNDREGKNALVEITEAKPVALSLPGLPFLEAAERPAAAQAKRASPAQVTSQRSPSKVDPYLIQVLQDERSQVGTKINVLDKLLALDPVALRAYLTHRTPKEPMTVTLTDLTRHGDRELAFKARQILKKANVESVLVDQLKSTDRNTRDAATMTLLRMESPSAMKILEAAKPANSAQIEQVKRQIAARPGGESPIPTGSPSGDRYFLQINWNPASPEMGRCVADSFLAGPPIEPPYIQGNGIPQNTELLLFWYSKEAVVAASERARRCGARTQFVSPQPMRSAK